MGLGTRETPIEAKTQLNSENGRNDRRNSLRVQDSINLIVGEASEQLLEAESRKERVRRIPSPKKVISELRKVFGITSAKDDEVLRDAKSSVEKLIVQISQPDLTIQPVSETKAIQKQLYKASSSPSEDLSKSSLSRPSPGNALSFDSTDYRHFFEQASAAMAIIDTNGDIITYNQSWENLTGCPSFNAKSIPSLEGSRSSLEMSTALDRALASENCATSEYHLSSQGSSKFSFWNMFESETSNEIQEVLSNVSSGNATLPWSSSVKCTHPRNYQYVVQLSLTPLVSSAIEGHNQKSRSLRSIKKVLCSALPNFLKRRRQRS